MKRYIAMVGMIGGLVTLLAAAVLAQSNFTAPGGQNVPMQVQGCLNASGQAVPCSTPTAGTPGTGFPAGATPVNGFATGTTAGATATLPAAAGKFTYLCGLHVEAGTATAAVTVNVTTTGVQNGTFSSGTNSPATAATATAGPIISQVFNPCLPSSAVNTAITVVASALGTGGVNQDVNAWGYQQ